MSVITITPGPNRYPEGGGMVAAPGKGINVLDLALHKGAKAKSVEIRAEGPVEVFLNGEEVKAHSANGDTRLFYYKGEGQEPGGQKCGTIETLEIVGSGKFNLIASE